MSDDEFLAAFEACTLPKEEFSHRQHVRLAWLYLGRNEFVDASRLVADGIKRFAARYGVTGLYHETITQAWLRLIADGRKRTLVGADTFAGFMEANPTLSTKGALDPYYAPETLKTDEARARFVAPDRAPLP
ncbi:MAG TPA: hypothetical protein VFQ51_07420 [Vicinamibacteria bacterium]|nr:hypothetical protein [Vicinamibacteria bacterium]